MLQTAKKLLATTFKVALLIPAAMLLHVAVALAFYAAFLIVPQEADRADARIPIYLFADDYHADLMIPIDPMEKRWDYLLETVDFPMPRQQVRLLSFGWGSREFYLNMREWSRLSVGLGLKALAYDATVMHVTAYHSDAVKTGHPMVHTRYIDAEGYRKLLDFIRQSFQRNRLQRAIHIPNMGYRSNDTFFEANGRYHPIHTCNQWTGEALRTAGVAVPFWTPFPHALTGDRL